MKKLMIATAMGSASLALASCGEAQEEERAPAEVDASLQAADNAANEAANDAVDARNEAVAEE